MCKKDRIYGCEEVTIGFLNAGRGDEIVDYCTMDSKGILRCYEIKVTLSDLKSHAKKSWYGHYNYLFVTEELYSKICNDLDTYIPKYIGIAVPNMDSWSNGVKIVRKAQKQNISTENQTMLKESLVRSMSYKIHKLRDMIDPEHAASLQNRTKKAETECNKYKNAYEEEHAIITRLERTLRHCYGIDVCFEELVEQILSSDFRFPETITLQLTERGKTRNKIREEENLA